MTRPRAVTKAGTEEPGFDRAGPGCWIGTRAISVGPRRAGGVRLGGGNQRQDGLDDLEILRQLAHGGLPIGLGRIGQAQAGERGVRLASFLDQVGEAAQKIEAADEASRLGQLELGGVGLMQRVALAARFLVRQVENDRAVERDLLGRVGIAPVAHRAILALDELAHRFVAAGKLPGDAGKRGVDRQRSSTLGHRARQPAKRGDDGK